MRIFAAALLVAIASLAARASAEVEYCPAFVHVAPVAVSTPAPNGTAAPATDFGLRLQAEGARTVSGVVALHAPDGCYQVAIPPTKLLPVVQTWRSSFSTYKRHVYESAPVYVRFAQPITVASAFMLQATTSGERVFGWDKRGTVACNAEPDALDAPRAPMPKQSADPHIALTHPRHLVESAPSDKPVLPAKPLSLKRATCRTPFARGRLTKVMMPRYPFAHGIGEPTGPSEAVVSVAISSSGKIDDAWVFGSSGNRAIDLAALHAALQSSYQPARAFCQNVPSIFHFYATFTPD